MNNIELRNFRYRRLLETLQTSGRKDIHIEESKLRLESQILDGKSLYLFNPKKDPAQAHETTLDRNDIFVPSSWGLFLGLRNDAKEQIEHLTSYVPVNDGTTPSVHKVAFKSDAAEAIYSGSLQWFVDNAVMISMYPTERFKKVPETQGLFLLNAEGEAVQEGIQSEWALDDMLQTIIPRLIIAGTRDHKIQVQFDAAGLTFPCTDGYTPYLCLYMDGFLIKGGCEYINGVNAFGDVAGQW